VVAASSGEDGENKGHQPENENYVNKPRDTSLKMRPHQNQMTGYLNSEMLPRLKDSVSNCSKT
jgi:hypothetical protein